MPAIQTGSITKQGAVYGVRYRDEHGRQKRASGFKTPSAARSWLNDKLQEVEALRRGDAVARNVEPPTLDKLCDEYLEHHTCEANTLRTLRYRLDYARRKFGDVRIDRLSPSELIAWRRTLPAGSAWHIVKALRQVLNHAVTVGLIADSPARKIPNPEPKRKEIQAFDALEDVEAVAAELPTHLRGVPVLGALTGLRPEELLALERKDIDRERGLLHVRRVFTDGVVKHTGKTSGSIRAVPLPALALEVLDTMPARLSGPIFADRNGGHLDLHAFRRRHWDPAVRAAGFAVCECGHTSAVHEEMSCQEQSCVCKKFERAKGSPTPYALRHTAISWWLAAGVPTFEVARIAGTSVMMIEKTYGHLLPDAHERVRTALDIWFGKRTAAAANANP